MLVEIRHKRFHTPAATPVVMSAQCNAGKSIPLQLRITASRVLANSLATSRTSSHLPASSPLEEALRTRFVVHYG